MKIIKNTVTFFILMSFIISNTLFVSALSDKFYLDSKYAGQWPIGAINFTQSRGTPNNSRDTMGMKGNFSNEIGVKTKIFTSGQSPAFYLGGKDINGDGKEDMLYGYGGKLYLGDITSGLNIWETKVIDVKSVLGVENVLGNGVQSIVVLLGEDRYLGVIDGKTGELSWTSHLATGPVKTIRPGSAGFDVKVFDTNNDGVKEYHFKQRYNKYHSFKLTESGGIVGGDTLGSTEGYGNYNEGSDGYQPSGWTMGKISNKLVVATKGSNTFAFYGNDVNTTLSGIDKFKMPPFGKWWVGGNSSAGWSDMMGYFYDINGDGNDEFISRINSETNNNKLSRIIAGGLDGSGSMVQYTSLSYPAMYSASGTLLDNGNFSTPIPLRDYSNASGSYILTYGADPVDSLNKWMMLKYNGSSPTGWKKTSNENESFNYSIVYDTFDPTYTPQGIFHNGQKDYVVLKKGTEYSFYNFNGTGTFLTGSNLKVFGDYYDIYTGLDTRKEMNKNSGIFFSSYDSNGNGLKEFVVTKAGYFRFYEISDAGVILLKELGPYTSIPGVIQRGLTENKKDIYAIAYNSTTNTINYYKTNSVENVNTFQKLTNDTFYAGGQVKDITVAKLGQGSDKYNKLMIEGFGTYDARNATPAVPPVKISPDYFTLSYDVDADGDNEVNIGSKTYKYNAPGDYTKKYDEFGYVGDINGDGVLDSAWAYCGSTPTVPVNLFLTLRDGKTGNQIVPDIDWGNGNGNCYGGDRYAGVSYDIDNNGYDEIVVGLGSRARRIISYDSGTNSVTQGNQLAPYSNYYGLQSYDVDRDGKQEIISGHDTSGIMKMSSSNKTQLTSFVNINPGVKSTFNISLGLPSIYRAMDKTYFAYRGVDGEVALMSLSGTTATKLFHKYYVSGKAYDNSDDVLNNTLIPLASADVLVGDFIGDNSVSVLVGGGDGGIYILSTTGTILKYFNIGSAIRRIIVADVSESGYLSVFVSAEDGYVYQLTNSNLSSPTWVKDGPNYGFDIESQMDNKKVSVNYASVSKATGYFVQLYNKTEKSVVFDWIDVGNKFKACIVSKEIDDANCTKAPKAFSLNGKSIYEWRVQSYNTNVTSPISVSNGFSVLNLTMDKKVAKKEDLNFVDDLTVSPNTMLTYKILVNNDSLNTVGGAGYMNYDMVPAQPVSSCSGISDCRTKNLLVSDYMPTSFTYMPNSTIWIVKKINNDGSEQILYGGSQVSDSYFRNQNKTSLTTTPGTTLIWEFPSNISIPPGALLELQFDAIARSN